MPDIEGHEFGSYAYVEWPKHVTRSDGTGMVVSDAAEAEAFLKDDADAMAAFKADEAVNDKVRAIQAKADAEIARIMRDAETEQAEVVEAAQAAAAAKAAEAAAPAKPAKSEPRTPARATTASDKPAA